jgi:hypothetical protein
MGRAPGGARRRPNLTSRLQVFPEQHAYRVELFDARGETIGLLDLSADGLGPAPEPID